MRIHLLYSLKSKKIIDLILKPYQKLIIQSENDKLLFDIIFKVTHKSCFNQTTFGDCQVTLIFFKFGRIFLFYRVF